MSFTDITNQLPGEAETFDNCKTVYSEQPNTLAIIPILLGDKAAMWNAVVLLPWQVVNYCKPPGFWEGGGHVGSEALWSTR